MVDVGFRCFTSEGSVVVEEDNVLTKKGDTFESYSFDKCLGL